MGGEPSKKRRFDEKRDLRYFSFCVQASIFGIMRASSIALPRYPHVTVAESGSNVR